MPNTAYYTMIYWFSLLNNTEYKKIIINKIAIAILVKIKHFTIRFSKMFQPNTKTMPKLPALYFVILDTTLNLKAFKDYPELVVTKDWGQCTVRTVLYCDVGKHSSPAALHTRSFNMHAQKNTPERCRRSVMCCDETVCDWLIYDCVFIQPFLHSGNMHQTMHERNETSKRRHCRCLFVSGLEVKSSGTSRFSFDLVTIWFQNDSRCISIFPAKDFSEILYYNTPALIQTN